MISIIVIAVILLIITISLLFLCRKENNRLLTELKTEKDKNNELKEEVYLLDHILVKVSRLIRINVDALNIQEIPYKIEDLDNDLITNLTSIRFKKVQDKVLIYINGAMVPYTGIVKFKYEDSFSFKTLTTIDNIINILDQRRYTNKNIIEPLRQIKQNLN